MEMEAPNFWDDPEKSQGMMKELKSLKDDMQTYQNLISQKEDMETLIEMGYEENDDSVIPEIEELLEEFKKDFENIRVKTLLSGEYDKNDAIVTLHAGAGGTEPATGPVCCTACTPAGQSARAMQWRFWIIWTARRPVSNL